jgi:hypothetical protein
MDMKIMVVLPAIFGLIRGEIVRQSYRAIPEVFDMSALPMVSSAALCLGRRDCNLTGWTNRREDGKRKLFPPRFAGGGGEPQ